VHFIDRVLERGFLLLGIACIVTLAGCGSRSTVPATTPSPTVPPPTTVRPPATPPTSAYRARNWDEYRVLASKRIVQVNSTGTYMGVPPEPLLAIPVLEVELHADGSVANIRVERMPRQATDTVQLAMNAIRRAAPFGPVSHLPRPWSFKEVFLFDDDRKFKPRSLDN
jgi:hypothetical protein